nr:flagellar biosynthetic protein FliO [Pseudomonas sp.]
MTSRIVAAVALLALGLLPAPAVAQAESLAGGGAALVRTALGLVFVVALILACAWAARRFGFANRVQGGAPMKIVSTLSLGPRDRVIMLEVDDTWLVVGVNAGGMTTLHSLPAKAAPAAPATPVRPDLASSFQSLLRTRMGKTPASSTQADQASTHQGADQNSRSSQ